MQTSRPSQLSSPRMVIGVITLAFRGSFELSKDEMEYYNFCAGAPSPETGFE